MRYWIGVASKEHVLVAVKGGFAQFGHGRLAPAKRPAKGDWIIYYSAKEKFGCGYGRSLLRRYTRAILTGVEQ
jgi:hypothetical protein